MAVDAARLRLYEDALLVGAHDVAIHTADVGTTGGGGIEKHTRLLARAERAGDNLLAVGRNLRITLTVGQRLYSCNALRAEHACGSDVLQRKLLSRHQLRDGHE